MILKLTVALVALEVLGVIYRRLFRKGPSTIKFVSNGCTGTPEGNWGECCIEHDRAYRTGGWFLARLKGDTELSLCILKNHNPFAALVYFVGVRLGGMFAFNYGKKRTLL